jgi:hypothetical protein
MKPELSFKDKAAALAVMAADADVAYSDDTRVTWLTLEKWREAVIAVADAAKNLTFLDGLEQQVREQHPLQSFISRIVEDIEAMEQMLSSVDIARAKSDVTCAGAQIHWVRVLSKSCTAVKAMSRYVKELSEAIAMADSAKSAREAFTSPSRPKVKYAAVKESFLHTKGGSPIQFLKGQHCMVDAETEKGFRIEGGSYSVFFDKTEVHEFFDFVEL